MSKKRFCFEKRESGAQARYIAAVDLGDINKGSKSRKIHDLPPSQKLQEARKQGKALTFVERFVMLTRWLKLETLNERIILC